MVTPQNSLVTCWENRTVQYSMNEQARRSSGGALWWQGGYQVTGAGGTGPQGGHERTGLPPQGQGHMGSSRHCKVMIRVNTLECWHYMPGTVLHMIFSFNPPICPLK